MNLQKRLDRLEAALDAAIPPIDDDPLLIIRFVELSANGRGADVPVNAYRVVGWGGSSVVIRRAEGESDSEFDERAKNEAIALRRPGDSCRVVLYPMEFWKGEKCEHGTK